MVLGRPKQFDRDQALEAALSVFWSRGFEATSIRDLVEAMGINRGSLYDTFGDKQTLFAEALAQYGRQGVASMAQTLQSDGSPIDNLRGLFKAMAEKMLTKPCKGCLLTNTAVELGPHNPAVAKVIQHHFAQIEKLFAQCLQKAVDARELPKDTEPKKAARFLLTLMQGMAVMAKSGSPATAARDAMAMAERALGVRPGR